MCGDCSFFGDVFCVLRVECRVGGVGVVFVFFGYFLGKIIFCVCDDVLIMCNLLFVCYV